MDLENLKQGKIVAHATKEFLAIVVKVDTALAANLSLQSFKVFSLDDANVFLLAKLKRVEEKVGNFGQKFKGGFATKTDEDQDPALD